MILPTKHTTLSESLLGLGSYILSQLDKPKTVDDLWGSFIKVNNTPKYPASHTFDSFLLSIDFLFILGLINQSETGQIFNATN
jgi:hypothetical protein